MATNFKSAGCITDANLLIATGATITAGSLIWVDISGTNVVRAIRSYSGAAAGDVESSTPNTGLGIVSWDGTPSLQSGVFIGVIANTQTGIDSRLGGNQTGVTYYRKGVFEFLKTPTSSCSLTVGNFAYPVRHDVIRTAFSGINATPTNATGVNPIGVVVGVRGGGAVLASGAGGSVFVKIDADRAIHAFA